MTFRGRAAVATLEVLLMRAYRIAPHSQHNLFQRT